MHRSGSAIEEEAFDPLHRLRVWLLEHPQPEALRDRRVDSVKDRVSARALHPRRLAPRIEMLARLGETPARMPFGTLQSPREIQVRKHHHRDSFRHKLLALTST